MAIVEEDAVATEAEDVDNYCFFHYFFPCNRFVFWQTGYLLFVHVHICVELARTQMCACERSFRMKEVTAVNSNYQFTKKNEIFS